MRDLRNKKITVVGLGDKTGVAVVRYLSKVGAKPFVTEMKKKDEVFTAWQKVSNIGAEFEFGGHSIEKVKGSSCAVLCPGVPIDSPFVNEITACGIEVISELELAYQGIESGKIIAVTGSNGKSTTVTMIGDILREWGKEVFVGGNLGNPLIESLVSGRRYEFYVVEVSTFQLEGIKKFRPQAGVLLNISPNHLDRHGSMEKYSGLKISMFRNQGGEDIAVLNMDDPLILGAAQNISGRKIYFSLSKDGADVRSKDGSIKGRLPDCAIDIKTDSLRLLGEHNLSNLMASSICTAVLGCPSHAIEKAIPKFRNLPHRIEYLGEINGVNYYDDSKSTTVDSTVKAISSIKEKIILLAGGRDKGAKYGVLGGHLGKHVKAVILFGEAREKMKEALNKKVPVHICGGLDEAVRKAKDLAQRGDNVLLSPANSSFDQFRDYVERGKRFQSLVKSVKDGN